MKLSFLLLAILCLIGCGQTYQKPVPISVTGFYEFDGVKITITPYGSNTVSEMTRFQSRNVIITVQERY